MKKRKQVTKKDIILKPNKEFLSIFIDDFMNIVLVIFAVLLFSTDFFSDDLTTFIIYVVGDLIFTVLLIFTDYFWKIKLLKFFKYVNQVRDIKSKSYKICKMIIWLPWISTIVWYIFYLKEVTFLKEMGFEYKEIIIKANAS